VHDLHEKVKATYAGISHALSQEQRREYRARIAQASALVQRARAQEYYKTPAFVRAAASLAMARAQATAEVLTDAVQEA
jgi:hypothetical protein